MKRKIPNYIKTPLWLFVIFFLLLNGMAYFQAYKLTHFSKSTVQKTAKPEKLSFLDKIKTLFTGVGNPRPENKTKPFRSYQTIKLKSNKEIECWLIEHSNAKGTVIIFHGYGGEKSSMLSKADIFYNLGYNTLLVDFMGSGGSEGYQTTIGFFEAEEVKTVYDYVKKSEKKKIVLFGTSMGAVAIMKAEQDYGLEPDANILECPFGSLLKTTQARFKILRIPDFPIANILVFWGGFQNNFNAFNHSPVNYAEAIKCPTLLLYGKKDERVSWNEITEIFKNLKGNKTLKTYPLAGHDNYLIKYKTQWTNDISGFLNSTNLK